MVAIGANAGWYFPGWTACQPTQHPRLEVSIHLEDINRSKQRRGRSCPRQTRRHSTLVRLTARPRLPPAPILWSPSEHSRSESVTQW